MKFVYDYKDIWNQSCQWCDGVLVSVLALGAVDHRLEPRSGQPKDYKMGICCFSTKGAALKGKSTDWLFRNQNDVSEWSDMSTHGL
jgi:hypothetical protein